VGIYLVHTIPCEPRSSVSIVAKLRKTEILVFATASRRALEPTQSNQWISEHLPPGVKWPGRNANHFYLGPKVKNNWRYRYTRKPRLIVGCRDNPVYFIYHSGELVCFPAERKGYSNGGKQLR
jgi:hypothetical protein